MHDAAEGTERQTEAYTRYGHIGHTTTKDIVCPPDVALLRLSQSRTINPNHTLPIYVGHSQVDPLLATRSLSSQYP